MGPELRERAVRKVFDHADEHPSQWTAIRPVSEKLRVGTEAFGRSCATRGAMPANVRADDRRTCAAETARTRERRN